MDSAIKTSPSLFEVYLRLRPNFLPTAERFLDVENTTHGSSTQITIRPLSTDHRKRAIEKFAFTRVFEEDAGQLDLFNSTGLPSVIEGVIGHDGEPGRDGLLATLGVTGSGKTHTILGTKSQRGLTQLSLDALYKSIGERIIDTFHSPSTLDSLQTNDISEAQLTSANDYLEDVYGDGSAADRASRARSRAASSMRNASYMSAPGASTHKYLPRLSALPQYPAVDDMHVEDDPNIEYAVLLSMYEVYNDRIFDLLVPSSAKTATQKRRCLLFKNTESSAGRKVVAGLHKVACATLDEAFLVLETGLSERSVAGTGSNATSSRSHGFFCIEVVKRLHNTSSHNWSSSILTIVDLAGSERARVAKTAGATLAEAGKINESLMYLGQCMQMQSDNADHTKQALVPFRQCKLTELLFSNSFATLAHNHTRKTTQKGIMIVTADPLGDFNATSQILRYSALAKEVTAPRIPSVTSTILAGIHSLRSGKDHHTSVTSEELHAAQKEISALQAQLDIAQLKLDDEVQRRREAEHSWQVAESRMEQIELDVRDQVWQEMEAKIVKDQRRTRLARERELVRIDEHMDKKLEILANGIKIHEDPDPTAAETIASLEADNQSLRNQLALHEREKGLRTPSKKTKILKPRKWEGSAIGLDDSS